MKTMKKQLKEFCSKEKQRSWEFAEVVRVPESGRLRWEWGELVCNLWEWFSRERKLMGAEGREALESVRRCVFDRSREAPLPLTKGKERCVGGDAGVGVGTWRWESECLLSCCNTDLGGLASQSVLLTHITGQRRTGFLSGVA